MNPFESYYRSEVRGATGSKYETLLYHQINIHTLPRPQREFRFHPTRQWRFDFAYPEKKIGIEVEGGIWNGGRHTRGKGFEGDCEKYNEAVMAGWKVLRFTPKMVETGAAVRLIENALLL